MLKTRKIALNKIALIINVFGFKNGIFWDFLEKVINKMGFFGFFRFFFVTLYSQN